MRWVLAVAAAILLCGSAPARPPTDLCPHPLPPPRMPPPAVVIPLDFFDQPVTATAAAPTDTRTWWRLRALTTAYTPNDAIDGAYHATKGERWRWITADCETDVREEPYGVAVDPRAIPYGTDIRVPGYHRGAAVTADDTGGRLRQSWSRGVLHLDLRYRHGSSATAWGRKDVVIEVDVTHLTAAQRHLLARFRTP